MDAVSNGMTSPGPFAGAVETIAPFPEKDETHVALLS